jgi:arabinose-5-phosphate isomerase
VDFKKLIEIEIENLRKIPTEKIEILIDYLILELGDGKIITSGIGKSGDLANLFSKRLCSLGIPSFFIHPVESFHGDLGMVGDKDVIILFSNSGETQELLKFIDHLKEIDFMLPIFSITGKIDNPISKKSRISINFGEVKEICPLGITPTTSITCTSLICDLIISGIVYKKDLTKEKYLKIHPGGKIGEILNK